MPEKQLGLNFPSGPPGLETFGQIEELFRDKGVQDIYIKHLARNQDNDKNQIYIGRGDEGVGVVNLFPTQLSFRSPSTSTKKRQSLRGKLKIEATLDFFWLSRAGDTAHAPNARIIDYFQYPETRFSGFLQGCSNPPDSLRKKSQSKYGKRIFVLGSNDEGNTFGIVLTQLEDSIVESFPTLPPCDSSAILQMHSIDSVIGTNPTDLLIDELRLLSGIWHPSCTLRREDKGPIPFKGNQGGGYTLEALLGVPRNAKKAPDKHGYELKAYKKSGKISLMTPTADSGKEGDMAFKEFMAEFGWPGVRGDGRVVFNGVHRFHKPNKRTGYVLDIAGYDSGSDFFSEQADEIVVAIMKPLEDLMVSGWTFQKLLDSWSEKHAAACYVEYEKRKHSGPQSDSDYLYTGKSYFAHGTTILHYLRAIASDVVYYDAGHEISADGSAHQRPQWRISVTSKIQDRLATLYNEVEEKQLI